MAATFKMCFMHPENHAVKSSSLSPESQPSMIAAKTKSQGPAKGTGSSSHRSQYCSVLSIDWPRLSAKHGLDILLLLNSPSTASRAQRNLLAKAYDILAPATDPALARHAQVCCAVWKEAEDALHRPAAACCCLIAHTLQLNPNPAIITTDPAKKPVWYAATCAMAVAFSAECEAPRFNFGSSLLKTGKYIPD